MRWVLRMNSKPSVSAGGEYTENQRFEMHMGRED